MVANRCHVTSNEIVAGDRIVVSRVDPGGVLGHLSVQNIVNGGFDIVSNATTVNPDTSTVLWNVVH